MKSKYIVVAGIAMMALACFLVREHIRLSRIASDAIRDAKLAEAKAEKFRQLARDADQDTALLLAASVELARRSEHFSKAPAPVLRPNREAVEERRKRALESERVGDYRSALADYLWLYDEGMTTVSSYSGVRNSMLIGQIARLGANYPLALDALRQRRNRAEEAFAASQTDRDALIDAISLNHVLNEEQRWLNLYDSMPPGDPLRKTVAAIMFDRLVSLGRYDNEATASAYEVGSDRIDLIQRNMPDFSKRADPIGDRKQWVTAITSSVASRVEALVGIGNVDQAKALAIKLLEFDDSDQTRSALQQAAARAGKPNLF